jgi:type I restriction enzyme S subunit
MLAPAVVVGRKGSFGKITYADAGGFCIDTAYFVDARSATCDLRWAFWALQSLQLDEVTEDTGVPGLSREHAHGKRLPIPATQAQVAIAAYLDRETARIDALIEKKTRFIELLREKRQALITQAVTQGLDPSVPMRDSGVEWLGRVPAHWAVLSFQRVVFIAEGQVDPELEPYRSMLLIAPNHVESGTGRLIARETAAEQAAESGKYQCDAGDVVYSKIRPALRKACIAPEPCLCSADMYPLRGIGGMTNPFLLWFLLSEPFSAFAVLEADRVAMPKINRDSLSRLKVPLPPASEQAEICAKIQSLASSIDRLIDKTNASIALLRERRSALITAAVTGQIDLSEAA